MFVTNWISTTKIQKISEITNFFRHYFLSRTEVNIVLPFRISLLSPYSAVAGVTLSSESGVLTDSLSVADSALLLSLLCPDL
jgi:hypothetical protein